MKVWLSQHLTALRDTGRRLLITPLATLLNIVVMGVALSLPVGLYLGLSQLQGLSRQVSSDPQVSLFLALDANPSDVGEVEQRLRRNSEIGTFRYVPRDRALTDLERNAGLTDVLQSLKTNPLPDAFVVTIRDNRPEGLEALRDEAAHWPKVEHVQLDSDWARKLDAALRVGRSLALVLGVLLSSALVAITFNTIRLQILTRREEIEVSKLIGATNQFIRRPFLYFGAVQGLAGGVAALLVVVAATWLLNRDLAGLSDLYAATFGLRAPSIEDSALLLGFSSLLGWLGAWLSVSRHLWQIDIR